MRGKRHRILVSRSVNAPLLSSGAPIGRRGASPAPVSAAADGPRSASGRGRPLFLTKTRERNLKGGAGGIVRAQIRGLKGGAWIWDGRPGPGRALPHEEPQRVTAKVCSSASHAADRLAPGSGLRLSDCHTVWRELLGLGNTPPNTEGGADGEIRRNKQILWPTGGTSQPPVPETTDMKRRGACQLTVSAPPPALGMKGNAVLKFAGGFKIRRRCAMSLRMGEKSMPWGFDLERM
ncbi:hypothetical protein AAFF_G00105460 [Aldrovandia affinis]|uniref:Uncharacterized protein n=1 Tax=Aldrovandia affinis TaxID=143900 RepID=A0AAD7WYL1_9TELE|nr:hypothetical protein AAFF_G00105460 [Aldrovandia affinis]